LDLTDIQGNVVPGFNKDHQAFVFVHFRSGEAGRTWLAALQPEIASSWEVEAFRVAFSSMRDRRSPDPAYPDGGSLQSISATWVNVALSFAGLHQLLGPGKLAGFSSTFRSNQVPGADTPGAPGGIDALLIAAADHASDLEDELGRQRQRMAACDVGEVLLLRGATLPGDQRGHEHFGFKDAISQPLIAGTTWGNGPPVAPGEFILGEPDETGKPGGEGLPVWTRNGSFLAFLQLQQHVDTFWKTMRQQAQQFGVKPEDLAAWIVGRKHDADGTQLGPVPARSSHIGRAYARWLPPAEASRHRLIRRGVPYGRQWRDGENDDGQRGLLFVTYQADLARQFEHVWTRWLGRTEFPVPGAGTDALVGQVGWPGRTPHSPSLWTATARRAAAANYPGQRGGTVSLSLPAFVTPHYGGYFFVPAIGALARLAAGTPDIQKSALPGVRYGSTSALRTGFDAQPSHR
jgi:Dyp-type peroxidase family